MTLRSVGAAIGTNNRMLLYYFGSKEKLIAETLLEASRRFPAVVAGRMAREIVALWRGLQFDLISTGDADAVAASYPATAVAFAQRCHASIEEPAAHPAG